MLYIPNLNFPSTSKPLPDPNDYIVGSFNRFFYKKINDKSYIEISNSDFNLVINNSFCNSISIPWILTGSAYNIIINNVLEVNGVFEQNKSNLITYPELKYTLTNFLEYWQGY